MPLLHDQIEECLANAVFLIRIDRDERVAGPDPDIQLMQELPNAVGIGFFFSHFGKKITRRIW